MTNSSLTFQQMSSGLLRWIVCVCVCFGSYMQSTCPVVLACLLMPFWSIAGPSATTQSIPFRTLDINVVLTTAWIKTKRKLSVCSVEKGHCRWCGVCVWPAWNDVAHYWILCLSDCHAAHKGRSKFICCVCFCMQNRNWEARARETKQDEQNEKLSLLIASRIMCGTWIDFLRPLRPATRSPHEKKRNEFNPISSVFIVASQTENFVI